MTLDEAITHAEDVAKEQDKLSKRYDDASGYSRSHNDDIRTSDAKKCERCAEDHRQLARWLRDYKWLKDQKPCEDAISRQVVKEQMIKYGFHAPDMTITEFVVDLPSVKPQELKTGHWILKEVRQEKSLVCSECKSDLGSICPTEYCSECGCRMLGVVEEEKYTAESEG